MIADLTRTLADLKTSQTGRVRLLDGDPAIRQRLGEMGLTPGCFVQVVRVAPLGDPLEISVRDYRLSLRRCESRCVVLDSTVTE